MDSQKEILCEEAMPLPSANSLWENNTVLQTPEESIFSFNH
jgi:hypothetical protein